MLDTPIHVRAARVHHAELDFQGDAGLAAFEAEMKVGVNGSAVALGGPAVWETLKYAKCEHGWTEPAQGAGHLKVS